jgi:CRP/FNR family transcriptional regulator, anaerobic regulatory protein
MTNIHFEKTTPEILAFFNYLKNLTFAPSIEDLALMLPFVQYKRFKKGESLTKVGEISQYIYFNIKGIGRSYLQLPNGIEKTYFIITEHTIFSDYTSVTSQTPATENIEALVDMEVFCMSYPNLLRLYEEHPVWETFGRIISDFNFAFSQKRLRSMMNDDAKTKYIKFKTHYSEIAHLIPQQVIASYLGITPQSLSRLKKEIDVL